MSFDINPMILYEDSQLVVINKPAGLAVESARVTETDLVSLLRARMGDVFLVHRLDQVVGGVLVFGKTAKAAALLSKQLTDGSMKKHYRALVCAVPEQSEGELTDYLIRDPALGRTRVTGKEEQQGGAGKGKAGKSKGKPVPKKAVLYYRVLSDAPHGEKQGPCMGDFPVSAHFCMLGIRLFTGRHHQIRAQLAHAGMPIAGDLKYGAPPESLQAAGLRRGEIALAAEELAFRHPFSKEALTFRIPDSALPQWFAAAGTDPACRP